MDGNIHIPHLDLMCEVTVGQCFHCGHAISEAEHATYDDCPHCLEGKPGLDQVTSHQNFSQIQPYVVEKSEQELYVNPDIPWGL